MPDSRIDYFRNWPRSLTQNEPTKMEVSYCLYKVSYLRFQQPKQSKGLLLPSCSIYTRTLCLEHNPCLESVVGREQVLRPREL
jgi:hypothetical protein